MEMDLEYMSNGKPHQNDIDNFGNIFFDKPSHNKSSLCGKRSELRKDFEQELKFNGQLLMTQRSEVSFQEKGSFNDYNYGNDGREDSCEEKEVELMLTYGEFMDGVSSEILKLEDLNLGDNKDLIMEYLLQLI